MMNDDFLVSYLRNLADKIEDGEVGLTYTEASDEPHYAGGGRERSIRIEYVE